MVSDWFDKPEEALALADRLQRCAKSAGATQAEAIFVYRRQSGLTYRDGEVSDLEQAEQLDLGLRVWVGDRLASLSGNQIDPPGLKDLAEQAVSRARLLPATPDITLPELPDTPRPPLEFDEAEPSLHVLIDEARSLNDEVLAREGIVNSDGGNAGWRKSLAATSVSNGLAYTSKRSGFSRSVSAEAGQGDARVCDYDVSGKSHREDLRPIADMVARATDRVLAKVGACPVEGFEGAVLFEPRTAKSLIAHFLSAINGAVIVTGQSFLKTALGNAVFPASVQILDDPSLPRGAASRIMDSEGQAPEPLDLVVEGILQSWLLDRRSAVRLGLQPNARAQRGGGGTINPAATNVLVSGGTQSPEDLISGVERGMLITDMMGQGLNLLTGDYSRGAAGFLIEQGTVGQPLQNMTVAGNLRQFFAELVLGEDTDFNGAIHAPSILLPKARIGGA